MPFKYNDARTIAERVAFGREINRLEGDSIIAFPPTWEPEMIMESFRTNGAAAIFALINKGYERGSLHLYDDEDGAFLYGILRMDHPSDGKQFLPLRATRAIGILPKLECKAIDAPRPLYRLRALASRPDAPVLLVEGEKAADAGQRQFLEHVVTTWPGGAQGLGSVDLRPLIGRDVTIWPDNDPTGRDAAEKLAALLLEIGAASVEIVRVPAYFPPKWDLADPVPALRHA